MITKAPPKVIAQLAPTGVLRAAINLSNFLLVLDPHVDELEGPSPSMARALADSLGVPVRLVPYQTPSDIADVALRDEWDVANIGNEPQRARHIDFSPAYCEIVATYMIRKDSGIRSIDDVDTFGTSIIVKKGSAYGLWLEKNIKNASLQSVSGTHQEIFDAFASNGHIDALAGLRPGLIGLQTHLEGSKILDGQFTSVQQSVGIKKGKPEAIAWLSQFVEDQKSSGQINSWIEGFGLNGKLAVAPSVR